MKKRISFIVLLAIAMGTFSVRAEKEVLVFIDRERVVSDVAPQIINDRVMLPFRSVFEKMGASVKWLEGEKKIIATNDNVTLEMTIGEKRMLINSEVYESDTAPVIVNDRTLIPVRVCAETFGCSVKWYDKSRVVEIVSSQQEELPAVGSTGINYLEIDPTVNHTGAELPDDFWQEKNWTKAEENGNSIVVSQLGNMPSLYESEKIDGLVTFKMKLEETNEWPSLIFSQQDLGKRYTQSDCYLISFLDDMVQLQKFVDGARNAIYAQNEFAPKAGGAISNIDGKVVSRGKEHEVTAGTIIEENGVRIVLIVDGKTIFDYLDEEENAIVESGYFGIYAGEGGRITFSPAE